MTDEQQMPRYDGMDYEEIVAAAQFMWLENNRLRELIQKTWKWEKNGCYECPLEKDCKVLCVYDGDCGMAVEIEKALQELGTEVQS